MSTMPKYRKKPVVIEAILFNGELAPLVKFLPRQCWDYRERGAIDSPIVLIDTLEGTMQANVGDYIIKGVQGEYYSCKPDIFHMTYDEVTDA